MTNQELKPPRKMLFVSERVHAKAKRMQEALQMQAKLADREYTITQSVLVDKALDALERQLAEGGSIQ